MPTSSLILFNKPYGVQSQFRDDSNNNHTTLSQYFTDKSLRVAGRLDATSEGLLILTSDGRVNKAITQPPSAKSFAKNTHKQGKTYLVQVEGTATTAQLNELTSGVKLKDGKTLPATAMMVAETDLPIELWQREPPIRERKNVPTSWLMLTIYEGKNRQVRRMTAHVGLPCLRLIRWSVAGFELGDLAVGEFVRIHLNSERCQQLGVIG
ncbi:pseudouridine synthase [Psychrobacter sp. AOP22-C1-22]|uniref:pseudouridine synthase n=1 Tax=unclassified Psychrobacter TaxID=196806 RepID=UPI001787AF78|nr:MULTISPECIES: pseudouridine synthase [unclassified Psychrobacter]MBE0405594.1 pseudouridine synthase [Psychrobacter sp. FME6]MBE0445909.1 pseudouridine synthase [Psychrobacter sp. FME5]MDN5801296.1 pseudouridine synthase [Psychrobacter sp.]MDN5891615.1 pseudouridine synthase [Psychrobacter sp.]